MCGIAGVITPTSHDQREIRDRLTRVVSVQNHRGPDASGIHLDEKVGFAHNRLSILDLSPLGNQPMRSRSERSVLCYNGEVYNFRDLAKAYSLDVRSRSDTEVILEAFEKVGPAIFGELNGMFAFAIHDVANNAVWLVRDRLGIKPLYLANSNNTLGFASEIKGLFALFDGMQKRIRLDALHEWSYYGNALGSRTMFQDVEQLEPGHWLRIDLGTGSIETKAFWSIDTARSKSSSPAKAPSLSIAAGRARDLLGASVKRQVVSDVPVGIFLSGGLDSSSIACLASRHAAQPLTTYSAAFDYEKERSELALAAEVARFCGSDHREIVIEGGQSADVVRRMVEAHDQPFSDAANIPLYLMSQSIGATHKVILQGDAGDEMFAGYQRHLTLQKYGPWRGLFRALRGLARLPINDRRYQRAARILSALGAGDDAKTMALFLTVEREEDVPSKIFGQTFRTKVQRADPFARYREIERKFSGLSIAEKMLLIDKSIILPDIFFQKVDRSTMAASVEVRVPFTDNDLLDFVLGLPPEVLLHGGMKKGLLRAAMKGILPPSVLAGKKRGFGVPFGYWVTGTFSEQFMDVIAAVDRKHAGFLDRAHVELLWANHKAGIADHGFMFWKLLNLSLWMQQYDVTP